VQRAANDPREAIRKRHMVDDLCRRDNTTMRDLESRLPRRELDFRSP